METPNNSLDFNKTFSFRFIGANIRAEFEKSLPTRVQ